jgi:hypothetical protein
MKRRVLLQAWVDYCSTGIIPDHLKPPQSADVISISTGQAA